MSALIFAMLLTVLLTMSAFAVDIGAAYTERRHDQNTVDAAVMSGAVEAVLGGGVIDDVVTEVRDKVDTTLGLQVSDEAWEACEDPDQLDHTTRELKLGNPVIDPETDCISFSDTFNEIRVRLPDQQVQAVFAPALGFDTLRTSAAAVARIQSPGGLGAPPFVALSTATQGDFVCLRTSSAGEPLSLMDGKGPGVTAAPGIRADPCNSSIYDPDSQSFGTLSPYRYKDGCTRQKADTEVAISLGIDHAMGFFERDPATGIAYSPGEAERVDGGASCTVAYPDTFKVETGFNAAGLRCSLISLDSSSNADKSLCNGVVPRLKLGDNLDSANTFAAEPLDNSAPWDYLRPADELWLGSVDASGDMVIPPFPNSPARNVCVTLATFRNDDDTFDPATAPGVEIDDVIQRYYDPVHGTEFDIDPMTDGQWDVFDRYDALIKCLELWNPATDPQLFTEEIALSPRFAFIPQVYEDNIDVPYVHIEGFLPSYMYRLYQATSGNGNTACAPADTRANPPFYIHDAGQSFGACGKANQNVDRMASLIFACGMVPATLCNRDTGYPNFAGLDIYDFRLVE